MAYQEFDKITTPRLNIQEYSIYTKDKPLVVSDNGSDFFTLSASGSSLDVDSGIVELTAAGIRWNGETVITPAQHQANALRVQEELSTISNRVDALETGTTISGIDALMDELNAVPDETLPYTPTGSYDNIFGIFIPGSVLYNNLSKAWSAITIKGVRSTGSCYACVYSTVQNTTSVTNTRELIAKSPGAISFNGTPDSPVDLTLIFDAEIPVTNSGGIEIMLYNTPGVEELYSLTWLSQADSPYVVKISLDALYTASSADYTATDNIGLCTTRIGKIATYIPGVPDMAFGHVGHVNNEYIHLTAADREKLDSLGDGLDELQIDTDSNILIKTSESNTIFGNSVGITGGEDGVTVDSLGNIEATSTQGNITLDSNGSTVFTLSPESLSAQSRLAGSGNDDARAILKLTPEKLALHLDKPTIEEGTTAIISLIDNAAYITGTRTRVVALEANRPLGIQSPDAVSVRSSAIVSMEAGSRANILSSGVLQLESTGSTLSMRGDNISLNATGAGKTLSMYAYVLQLNASTINTLVGGQNRGYVNATTTSLSNTAISLDCTHLNARSDAFQISTSRFAMLFSESAKLSTGSETASLQLNASGVLLNSDRPSASVIRELFISRDTSSGISMLVTGTYATPMSYLHMNSNTGITLLTCPTGMSGTALNEMLRLSSVSSLHLAYANHDSIASFMAKSAGSMEFLSSSGITILGSLQSSGEPHQSSITLNGNAHNVYVNGYDIVLQGDHSIVAEMTYSGTSLNANSHVIPTVSIVRYLIQQALA